ncbi:tRNA1(Val) (adenine(37)-N6)-methyltransferase [Citreimonas salinaria]|uniref:tRNA1(Val) A37 N6-methylase TrmN6 n=1 Tax=Citreimonas salinaria TaxID=321339 RepID=A0A1H3HR46_9RHOB|nr:methyltransferase [Citreimonas salinaria]SDY17715.1 tRNA1(Val) A37 N6-methylase TrmN6 [Citreimonas salinaria]
MRHEPFADEDLTRDAFLGGRLHIRQPRAGYRAGIDPVLLAAAIPARSGETALELGCGAAPALCCLGIRVPGLTLAGLELQPGYAHLARRNLAENALVGTILTGDVTDPPADLRAIAADHVLINPPYFEPGTRSPAPDPGREIALAGPAPLAAWIDTAARRLKPGGTCHVVLRAERLPEALAALAARLGSIEALPLLPRAGLAPRLVLLRARKGGRAAFRLHAGLVLHEGDSHARDGDDYAPAVSAVLRNAEALKFPA